MSKPDPWQVMATHEICYKGETGKVEVIQLTNRTPEIFFFVHLPSRDILLSRFGTRSELWNGTSLRLDEAKALGEFIEQQIGYHLPTMPVIIPSSIMVILSLRLKNALFKNFSLKEQEHLHK